nr:hypothetical protein [Sedimentibacter sp.]
MIEKLTDDHRLSEIYQSIKDLYLSRTCFPKLMVGTGLSINYGVAGMNELLEALENKFEVLDEADPLKVQWYNVREKIHDFGLEKGLEELDYSKNFSFIDMITICTAEVILNDLSENLMKIKEQNTGFKKLLKYLINSCSTNNKLVDIMTPNYDLIIELICDDLGVETIDGFTGNIFAQFNHQLIKMPAYTIIGV